MGPTIQIHCFGNIGGIMPLMFPTKIFGNIRGLWNIGGKLVYISLVCTEYEESTPCPANSHCSETSGAAECICNDEYEAISNSFCTNLNDVAVCECDNTYDTYVLNNSNYETTTDLYFNDTDSQSLKHPYRM